MTEEATIEAAEAATGVGVVLTEEAEEAVAPMVAGAEAALTGAEEVVAVIAVVEEGAATGAIVRPPPLQALAGRGVRK